MRRANNGAPSDIQLARDVGVDRVTVSRIVNGHAAPGIKFVAGVIAAYGREWFDDFFVIDAPKPSRKGRGAA